MRGLPLEAAVFCYRKSLEMSCCHGPVPRKDRPGSARVLVTELSGSGHINPTPTTKPCEDPETEVELHLSAEKLKSLCGTWDLSFVTSLEFCVDTQETTLGNFGALLPKLVQLKMNNSAIMSVRDLGTTLSHLQVLWMSRCCLQDLDGISTFSCLKELYVAYNSVSDLSQLGMMENLQLLDLEGNDVDDLVQVQYLGLCGKLQKVTLEGNPVCVRPTPTATQTSDYRYRAAVRELVPQLHYLDNVRVEDDGLSCSSTMGEDWAVLRNSIRDCSPSQSATEDEETAEGAWPDSRPSSARRPASSRSCVWPLSSAGSRPQTGSRPMSATRSRVLSPPGSRPGSADSDIAAVEAETSILTHGAGKIVYCGNPVQAIRARREKLKTAPTKSTFTPRDLLIHVPEHTYDLEEPDVRERGDVFAELRAWREQHSRRLQAIETERVPQVLAIQHSDEEEEGDDDNVDDDEEEGFGRMGNDRSDEEHGGERRGESQDSSFQSLSPDLHHREAIPPDMARLSLSSDTSLSPSPPVSATAAPGNRKPQGFRARRLRLSQADSEHLPVSGKARCSHQIGTAAGHIERELQQVQQVTRTRLPQVAHIHRPPPTSAPAEGHMDPCVDVDSSSAQSGNKPRHVPQMSKLPHRPAITRPHTARAALQKHHPHHTLQPCRGSSHPD
ncbi:leucine-rich repeat-containing protein 56 [Hippoglossus stenolepis]|uniref:leucine-rich repeat-containing protein 56 n=1 Tax=Hippoglossus stenolepis TaxID=195615 RepID=UPI00159C3515|nr:leucine-rich repeat-containing protein 56 [Hippoglossus stenolepis]